MLCALIDFFIINLACSTWNKREITDKEIYCIVMKVSSTNRKRPKTEREFISVFVSLSFLISWPKKTVTG